MKNLIKKIVSRSVKSDILWKIMDTTLVRIARYAQIERNKSEEAHCKSAVIDIHNVIMKISPDLIVRHGVFQGMRYLQPISSALIPKILGSYEKEIETVLSEICSQEYTEIVNIGCAEGYYAIGLARRIPTARVFAYDIDKEAIRLCKKMAQINNVSERIVFGFCCDENTLKLIPFTKKALIISDCEGYEKELFTEDLISILAPHDLLIEIHDFIDNDISSYIRDVFKTTHDIEVFNSIDDCMKAQQYTYDELKEYDLETRQVLLGEYRSAIMEWLYMKPRSSSAS